MDDQQFEALLTFTSEVQEAIEQVYFNLSEVFIHFNSLFTRFLIPLR